VQKVVGILVAAGFKDVNDFSTIHTTEIIPVDLNCLLFHLEETLLEAYKLSNNTTQQNLFAERTTKRKAAIQQYCWNEASQFYFDYDFVTRKQKNYKLLLLHFLCILKLLHRSRQKLLLQ
jgi:alpha,alpha-trehalase